MKELKKFIYLSDKDFGKLVKNYFYYMEHKDLPSDIEDRAETLFNTTIKKKCDRQIKDTERKRGKRNERN